MFLSTTSYRFLLLLKSYNFFGRCFAANADSRILVATISDRKVLIFGSFSQDESRLFQRKEDDKSVTYVEMFGFQFGSLDLNALRSVKGFASGFKQNASTKAKYFQSMNLSKQKSKDGEAAIDEVAKESKELVSNAMANGCVPISGEVITDERIHKGLNSLKILKELFDVYIDPSLLEGLKKSPKSPPEVDPNTKVIPTGWNVPPTNVIPEFIFIPSTAEGIVDMSAPIIPAGKTDINDESLTIIPTGWGDEEDSQFIKAWDLQGRQLKGASTLNNTDRNVESMFGTAENHIRGWKQDRRNGDMFSGETINAWEHHQHRNDAHDRRHGRRGGVGSNHANLRCHEKDYLEYNRMKSIKEKYFWRQKSSFDRGLSCTPGNH